MVVTVGHGQRLDSRSHKVGKGEFQMVNKQPKSSGKEHDLTSFSLTDCGLLIQVLTSISLLFPLHPFFLHLDMRKACS